MHLPIFVCRVRVSYEKCSTNSACRSEPPPHTHLDPDSRHKQSQTPARDGKPPPSLLTTDATVAPTWTCSRLRGAPSVPAWEEELSATLGTDATMLGRKVESTRLLLEPRLDDTMVDEGSALKVNAEDVASRVAPATTAVAIALRLLRHFVMIKAKYHHRGGSRSSRTRQAVQTSLRISSNGKEGFWTQTPLKSLGHNAFPVLCYLATRLGGHLESYGARNSSEYRKQRALVLITMHVRAAAIRKRFYSSLIGHGDIGWQSHFKKKS